MNTRALLVAVLAALGAASAAHAKVYLELRPRASLLAGLDDNVPLDGSGGDGFGQIAPGLKLDLFGDHSLRFNLDCQANLAALAHPGRFNNPGLATSEACGVGLHDRLGETTGLHLSGRFTYAQDPFAISGLGLLLRPGQTQVFHGRLGTEVTETLSARSQLLTSLQGDALAFGAGDPGNGFVLTPAMSYLYRSSVRTTWDAGVREQLFYAMGASATPALPGGVPAGLLAEGTAALFGWSRKITPVATATMRAGPLLITSPGKTTLMPAARFELEAAAPTSAVNLVLAHDTVIGPSRAGPLQGDLAEVALMGMAGDFSGHLRAGVYRNQQLDKSGIGTVGYGGELSVDYRIAREWTLGIAGLRDARLTERQVGRQVDRNVLQLRLTWEKAKE